MLTCRSILVSISILRSDGATFSSSSGALALPCPPAPFATLPPEIYASLAPLPRMRIRAPCSKSSRVCWQSTSTSCPIFTTTYTLHYLEGSSLLKMVRQSVTPSGSLRAWDASDRLFTFCVALFRGTLKFNATQTGIWWAHTPTSAQILLSRYATSLPRSTSSFIPPDAIQPMYRALKK